MSSKQIPPAKSPLTTIADCVAQFAPTGCDKVGGSSCDLKKLFTCSPEVGIVDPIPTLPSGAIVTLVFATPCPPVSNLSPLSFVCPILQSKSYPIVLLKSINAPSAGS